MLIMNKIFRIEQVEIDGYYFIGYEGLIWHSGEFWFNEQLVKKIFNNGSLSILMYGNSKKSIKQLRKLARKCRVKIIKEQLPF